MICLSIAGKADAWGEGAGLLRSVAAAYDQGTTRLADVAAESHHLLGLLEANRRPARTRAARRCAPRWPTRASGRDRTRGTTPERTADYWAAVADLKSRLGDVDGARTAYDEALATASDASAPPSRPHVPVRVADDHEPRVGRQRAAPRALR